MWPNLTNSMVSEVKNDKVIHDEEKEESGVFAVNKKKNDNAKSFPIMSEHPNCFPLEWLDDQKSAAFICFSIRHSWYLYWINVIKMIKTDDNVIHHDAFMMEEMVQPHWRSPSYAQICDSNASQRWWI